ncbi:MAG: hypothetical protein QOF84_2551, partial [Streptomyces sp.]|nr:hypothetical protein [Streptomyces sp.]
LCVIPAAARASRQGQRGKCDAGDRVVRLTGAGQGTGGVDADSTSGATVSTKPQSENSEFSNSCHVRELVQRTQQHLPRCILVRAVGYDEELHQVPVAPPPRSCQTNEPPNRKPRVIDLHALRGR